jgi:tRNA (guanosine-2'-O-)-methyltransferase
MLRSDQRQLLTDHFSQYISDHKKDFMEKVLAERTRHITVVLEDIYQSQNASAVVRTCECMGVQDIHIVENHSRYSVNPKVLKGANKWIDLIRYNVKNENNTASCFQALREKGYRILATDPAPGCLSLHDIPVSEKLAIVMGNELKGTSPYALEHADEKVRIPMFGFTESLNISVSAAICLSTLLTQLRHSKIVWGLSEEERKDVRLQWYRKVVRRSSLIEREFFMRHDAALKAERNRSAAKG